MRGQIRTASVTLKHVQTIRKGGRVYRYLRLPGQPRTRLPDLPPDDPAFLAAYAEAVRAAPQLIRAPAGTIRAMAEGYLRTAKHSPAYMRMMRRHIDAICAQAEDALARHLRAEHIQADLAPLSPNVAGHRLKAWRAICRHGLETGIIAADPSRAVVKKTTGTTEGHTPWNADEVQAFRAAYRIGLPLRAVFEALHWTGARISDVVRIGPGHVGRDGVLAFRQVKTRENAFVPWSCPLPAYAAARAADRQIMHEAIAPLAGHMTFLQALGRSRSHKAAGHAIAEAARKIGIDKTAHGLRKLRAQTLAEDGATVSQIAAWTGHRSLSEVQHYTAAADRRRAVIGTEQDRNSVNRPDPDCKLSGK